MRGMNSSDEVNALQPNPVYLFAEEVNTVEQLETLFQNHDFVNMHALMLRERIFGRYHISLQSELFRWSRKYKGDGEFRRSFEILRYAYQMQNAHVEQMTDPHRCSRFTRPLYKLCVFFFEMEVYSAYHQPNSRENFRIQFEDVFEILQMATTNVDDATGVIYSKEFQRTLDLSFRFMKSILYLLKLITELDKNEEQTLKFKKSVYRLIRCKPITSCAETLLVVVTPVVYTLQRSNDGRSPAARGLSSLERLYKRKERGVRKE